MEGLLLLLTRCRGVFLCCGHDCGLDRLWLSTKMSENEETQIFNMYRCRGEKKKRTMLVSGLVFAQLACRYENGVPQYLAARSRRC